jgi:membrane-bound lytic murein transglycosylase A
MRERAPDHEHPLLAMPTAPTDLTRREIEGGGLADAAALFWLSDPVDVFFLQIQGSGRLSLPDGSTARVGYGGRNAHEYRSIGRLLVEEGEMSVEEVTAERLKVWLRADPERGRALMHRNPAYIFFREVDGLLPDDGPIGSAGVPLTPLRSVALDPAAYPPGSPVWVETTTADGPLRRMMIAQDTGSAITGPGRADLFFGTGAVAGDVAGAMRAPGRLWLLTPRAAEQAG